MSTHTNPVKTSSRKNADLEGMQQFKQLLDLVKEQRVQEHSPKTESAAAGKRTRKKRAHFFTRLLGGKRRFF